VDELGVVHLVEEAEAIEHEVRRRRQRFTDVVSRVDVLLDDQGLVAVLRQERAERGAGRPSPDDDDVGVQGSFSHFVILPHPAA